VWVVAPDNYFDDQSSRSLHPPDSVVGSEGRRGRWGTPTIALHMSVNESEGNPIASSACIRVVVWAIAPDNHSGVHLLSLPASTR